jgi:hypothetical protein
MAAPPGPSLGTLVDPGSDLCVLARWFLLPMGTSVISPGAGAAVTVTATVTVYLF